MLKKVFCFLTVTLMILGLAACAAPSAATPTSAPEAATPEPPQTVVFTDPVLEEMVRAAMNQPEGDILVSDAEALTELRLSIDWQPQIPPETQIQDISALASFKNLETLELSFHNIRDISPLTGLTKLTALSLGGNQVADITPLSNMSELRNLTLFNCAASDYTPLTKLSNLDFLMLDYSTITDLRVLSGLSHLGFLSLTNTQINDVSPLAGLTSLWHLSLENCPIKDYSPLIAIYPGLREKDFALAASLRELGFVALGENMQIESYKTDKIIVQVNHEDWGKQENADEVNAVILLKDHGTDNELGMIYYPDQKLYLVFSHKYDFRYTYDINTKALNYAYGEEAAKTFLQNMYPDFGDSIELAPIADFEQTLMDTFGVSANVLYLMPREIKQIDASSLAALGFIEKQDMAAYYYDQNSPRYYNLMVHNPDWGNWDEGGDVKFFTPLSDSCRIVVTYYASERKYMVKADDNDGGGAGYYFYLDSKTTEDIWCSDPNKTVLEYFTEAYNNPDIKDIYLQFLPLMEESMKDSIGLSLEELFTLPAGM